MIENRYYVYAHINNEGEIVYVGKGSYDRAWNIKGRDTPHQEWMMNTLPNINILFLKEDLIEKEAFWAENEFIKQYKPKFNNSFSKYNSANPNYKHGNRVGVKRNPKFKPDGTLNLEYNPNLKQGNSAKQIRCVTTGIEYPSAKEAAMVLSIDPSGITKVLKGKVKSTMGFVFEYVI